MSMRHLIPIVSLSSLFIGACHQSDGAPPLHVAPAEAETRGQVEGSAERVEPAERAFRVEVELGESERTPRPSVQGSASDGLSGGLWVVDNAGEALGVLVRRGSDDNLVYRAIYDLVTVFHPGSGLFFEVTMSDGLVRRPSTTFFASATCDDPIGISYGGCAECRSGPGTGVLHDGSWYRVVSGLTYEVTTAGSTMGSGLQDQCSSHHTDSAKIFPLEEITLDAPPSSFEAPLHFEWR